MDNLILPNLWWNDGMVDINEILKDLDKYQHVFLENEYSWD